MPDWFRNWEATGLIAFENKNGDGRIQYVGKAADIENELTIDRDIMVLVNPEIARPAIIGFVVLRCWSYEKH